MTAVEYPLEREGDTPLFNGYFFSKEKIRNPIMLWKEGEKLLYQNVIKGTFLERPNRFIAKVEVEGEELICHVKNTGRCRELLIPGAEVSLAKSDNPNRKTKYDLITVQKGDLLVNLDSQAPNQMVEEWLLGQRWIPGIECYRREVGYGDSRFDFYLEREKGRKGFLEVKGVTLEENGVVKFPDAPTLRGVKHIRELCKAVEAGYEGYLLFAVQMERADYFTPNTDAQPEFAQVLREARARGVILLAFDSSVDIDRIFLRNPVEIRL